MDIYPLFFELRSSLLVPKNKTKSQPQKPNGWKMNGFYSAQNHCKCNFFMIQSVFYTLCYDLYDPSCPCWPVGLSWDRSYTSMFLSEHLLTKYLACCNFEIIYMHCIRICLFCIQFRVTLISFLGATNQPGYHLQILDL